MANAPERPVVDPHEMQQLWDQRYAHEGEVWSGKPNAALVGEAQTLTPGRALDVGCGEGADAIWLAQSGWDVTGLDVSGVALGRARSAAADVGVSVRWLHAGLLDAPLAAGAYDLVAALYPALIRTGDQGAEWAMLDAVAVGGTLLFVHHSVFGSQPHGPDGTRPGTVHGHGPGPNPAFGPQDLVGVADMRATLVEAGDDWRIVVDEQRPREIEGGAGAHFSEDMVLRALRLA